MFKAKRKDGSPVWIDDAIKGEGYFCPVCDNPLIIKAVNSQIATHFAHKKWAHCPDIWECDTSEWHKTWQNRFPKECREVVVEKNGIKHRADILINNTVIEFQHSHISHEEILERNEFYLSCGYRVVWIFDAIDKIDCDYPYFIETRTLIKKAYWKSGKPQFYGKLQQGVTVYLQSRGTKIFSHLKKSLSFDFLIECEKINSQYFTFFPTKAFILPINFLQEYGINTGACSISQIKSIPTPQNQNIYTDPRNHQHYVDNLVNQIFSYYISLSSQHIVR